MIRMKKLSQVNKDSLQVIYQVGLIQLYCMLQAMNTQHIEFSDDNLQVKENSNEVRLPKIERPSSKYQSTMQKSNTKFPSLKLQSSSYQQNSQPQQSFIKPANQPNIVKKISQSQPQEQFVIEVEKRLKMVLEEQNLVDIEDSYGSDDDFQQKINENKEIIKRHKLKMENEIHPNNFINLPITKNKNNKKISKLPNKPKNRNQSLYEKRAKQYRDVSAQNKYLQKKKENVISKVMNQMAAKQFYSKQSIVVNKIHKIQEKEKEKEKQKDKEKQTKQTNQIQSISSKNQDLFDGIQNFLQNPKKSSIDLNIIKLSHKRTRKQLQNKIRQIQEKIGSEKLNIIDTDSVNMIEQQVSIDKRQISTPPTDQVYHPSSLSEWRKVELIRNKIQSTQTNFDKQVQKINRYLQRGENSLQKYVQNQQILLELQLWKKSKLKGLSQNKLTRGTEQ